MCEYCNLCHESPVQQFIDLDVKDYVLIDLNVNNTTTAAKSKTADSSFSSSHLIT